MNNELIRAWHADLISGEHKQGFGSLEKKTNDGDTLQCCLGVLCRTAIRLGLDINTTFVTHNEGSVFLGNTDFGKGNEYSQDILPSPVARFLYQDEPDIMVCQNPMLLDGVTRNGQNYATEFNDNEGYNFAQIAECIKRTWPDAFPDTLIG